MASRASSRLLSGIDFDPLLGAWPDPSIDQRLLNEAPAVARYVLKRAYRHYQEGFNEPEELWDEWLALFEQFGPEDEGVQLGLMGLVFQRHEARHHLDTFATPVGWFLPQLIAGEYVRLRQLIAPTLSDEARADVHARLRRHWHNHSDLLGNVTAFRPARFSPTPHWERRLPDGVVRLRQGLDPDPRTVLTVQRQGGTERALSTNAILECRALLETSGYCAGRLRAAGAGQKSVDSAIALLLRLGVDPSRDDYWALLHTALPADNADEAARAFNRPGIRAMLMLATWFGLHVQHPSRGAPDAAWTPAFRSVFALMKVRDVESEWGDSRIDWEQVPVQLSEFLGDLDLTRSARLWCSSLDRLGESLTQGEFGDGAARAHLTWILSCAREGLALRGPTIRWLDGIGWPAQEDPTTVMPNADPPAAARAGWSRLTRVNQFLRLGTPLSSVRDVAETLF